MKKGNHAWLVAVVLAAVLAWPVLMGADQVSCVPVPSDPVCAGPGEYVFPWDPSYGVCCPGLVTRSSYDISSDGECQELVGGALCLACGDGVCGVGEDFCNCPEDCPASCAGLDEAACIAQDGCLPGYRGFCDCTCPGPAGYEGGGCDGCSADCFVFAGCVSGPMELDLDLDTSGGFTGMGSTDYHLHDGILRVGAVYRDSSTPGCAVELTQAQKGRLLTAAGHVDWVGLAPSYVNPDNPYCCCDQFVYQLETVVRFGGGSYVSAETVWCDEVYDIGSLPWGLLVFLEELEAVGDEVLSFCHLVD